MRRGLCRHTLLCLSHQRAGRCLVSSSHSRRKRCRYPSAHGTALEPTPRRTQETGAYRVKRKFRTRTLTRPRVGHRLRTRTRTRRTHCLLLRKLKLLRHLHNDICVLSPILTSPLGRHRRRTCQRTRTSLHLPRHYRTPGVAQTIRRLPVDPVSSQVRICRHLRRRCRAQCRKSAPFRHSLPLRTRQRRHRPDGQGSMRMPPRSALISRHRRTWMKCEVQRRLCPRCPSLHHHRHLC